MDPTGTRVVFMGSPTFAEPTLRALNSAGYLVPLVITQPDRPAGRGSKLTPPPVKVLAESLGLPVFQPETLKKAETLQRIRDAAPDVLVVAAYGKIIPRTILEIPSRGALNVHASLLPRWRGASPIESAILAGDHATGVTIMEVVQKMDAGPIVSATQVPIDPADTAGSLETRLAERGAELLVETLPGWYDGEIAPHEQDESQVTYCSLIKKEDGHLAAGMTAGEAERAVRAYNPWPGAFVAYGEYRLGIWKARVEPDAGDAAPGDLVVRDREPAIAFRDGLLVLEEVQRQGARRMRGRDFLNGERDRLQSKVGLR